MTQPQFSPAVINTMMDEIADGYTLNTVCSGCGGRPTLGAFLRLMNEGGEQTRLFVEALDISCWVLADEIRDLEATTAPHRASAHKAQFEMLGFEIKRRERVIERYMRALKNTK